MRPSRARRPGRSSPSPGPPALIAILVLAAGVAQGFGRFGYALLLPAVNDDLVHSYAVAGFLGTLNLTAYLGGTLLVSLTAGRLAPATSVRRGLVLTTAGVSVLALAPSVPVLAVGMVLAGFGGAMIWVPAPGIAGSAVHGSRRGLAIGLTGSGVGLGVIVSSGLTAVVHAVAGSGAWRPVWAIEAVLSALVAVAAARWLRPQVVPVTGPVRISALRAVPGWIGSTLSYGGYGLAIAIYMTFLVTAYEDDAGFGSGHASGVFALVGVCITAGGILLGRWSDTVGRRAAMTWAYVGMTVAILLVPVGAEPWAASSAVLFGLAMSGAPAVLAAHLADWLDPRRFAAAFGAVTLVFGLAQLVGPQLGGWIADRTGSFSPAFLLAAASAFGAACAAATLPRRRVVAGRVGGMVPPSPVVVVTGANGLVGTAVCRALVERRAQVRAVVRRAGTAPALDGVTECVGDFADERLAREVTQGADAVVSTVHPMGSSGEVQHRVGVEGTLVLARAAREAGVARLVHVSTAGVYDRSAGVGDVAEDGALLPEGSGAYPDTKNAADAALAHVGGLTTVLVRPPAIIGAGDTSVWNTLRPREIRDGERRANPAQTWGWVHVDDLAALIADVATGAVATGDDPQRGPVAGATTPVIVAGEPATWGDYLGAVTDALGVAPEWTVEPVWTGQLLTDRARGWGWAPRVSLPRAMEELRQGLTPRP